MEKEQAKQSLEAFWATIEKSVRDDAEECSTEELEAAGAIFDHLMKKESGQRP